MCWAVGNIKKTLSVNYQIQNTTLTMIIGEITSNPTCDLIFVLFINRFQFEWNEPISPS